MATTFITHERLSAERRFFLGMAAALALCTFAGFAQSYYLMRYTGAPSLAPLVHLHGGLFTAWVLLFGLQSSLISARRHDIHMVTGIAGIALATVMTVVGIAVALLASRAPALSPLSREQFLIFPFTSIGLFALFVALAFANRHRSDWHKRFMLVATINVVIPALARMTLLLPFLPRGVLGAMVIVNVFLVALALFDWRSLGRLHPATMWAAGITLLSEPARFLIARSDWWPDIARALIALVR